MKIKDILKWKLESFEQKQKLKDEKQIQLEVAINRLDKQIKDTVSAISDATQQEFHKMQNHILNVQDKVERFDQQLSVVKESLLHQVTKSLADNFMAQVDLNVKKQLDLSEKNSNAQYLSLKKEQEQLSLKISGLIEQIKK